VFDGEEFLSAHGLRSMSRYHRDHPVDVDVEGYHGRVDYEPGESRTGMFGGNSNWRGPVWAPLHYLLVDVAAEYGSHVGPVMLVEFPTGSGRRRSMSDIMEDLRRRFIALFVVDSTGERPCFGGVARLQRDPAWNAAPLYFEYFHGDNGAGLGASHQTGWTALVADLVCGMRAVATLDDGENRSR
jgi:hypothetical protein